MASDAHGGHIGLKTHFAVFFSLMILTVITVVVSYYDFEPWNDLIAMAIATFKGALVVLFFMHVWHSSPLTKIVLITALFFFAILVAFVYADVFTREMLNVPGRPPSFG